MRTLFPALVFVLLGAHAALADVPPNLPAGTCDGRTVHIVPIMATHTLPPYPPESVKAQEQGTTLLRVGIAPDGSVVDDTLVQSSGFDRLDAAALDFVKKSWRWQALPECHAPVPVAVSISWHLRSTVPVIDPATALKLVKFLAIPASEYPPDVPKRKAVVLVSALINERGEILRTILVRGSGNAAIDAKSQDFIKRQTFTPMQLNGKPAPGMAVIGAVWTPPDETPLDPDQISKVLELLAPPPPPPPP